MKQIWFIYENVQGTDNCSNYWITQNYIQCNATIEGAEKYIKDIQVDIELYEGDYLSGEIPVIYPKYIIRSEPLKE